MKTLSTLAVLATWTLSHSLPSAPPSGPQDRSERPVVFHWSHAAPDEWSAAQRKEFADISRLMGAHLAAHYPALCDTSSYRSARAFHFFNTSPSFAKRVELDRVLASDDGWKAFRSRWSALGMDYFGEESFQLQFTIAGGPPRTPQGAPRPPGSFRILWHARTDVPRSLRAARFARDVVAHLEATCPEVNLWILSPRIDQPGSFYWLFDYASAMEFDRVQQRLLEDDVYLELFDRAGGLFDSIDHEPMDLVDG